MHKWHANSVIGHGRPLSHDFQRVADGIAASLRQFSISISRAEENGEAPRQTRAQRGAEAAKEILATPRGIDARSLAAKPPSGPPRTFTITRQMVDSPSRRGNLTPRGFQRDSRRGGARGGLGARSRGGKDAAGRGRGRGGKKREPRKFKPKLEDEDDVPEPFNEEEVKFLAGDVGGWPTPYEPKTSLEQLLGQGLTVMGTPNGTLEAAMAKVQLGTDNVGGVHRHSDQHIINMKEGDGTFFESKDAKAVTQKYLNEQRQLRAQRLGKDFTPMEITTLQPAEREKLSKAWVAGHYSKPKAVGQGDVLGLVDRYAFRNETYLPEDSRKLQAKLASLLPSLQKPAAAKPPRKVM